MRGKAQIDAKEGAICLVGVEKNIFPELPNGGNDNLELFDP